MSRRSLPRHLSRADAERMAAGFVARRRAMHGNATMTAPAGTETTTEVTTGVKPETGQSTTGGQDGGQPEPKFTQADLDRILGERLASEKAKFDKQLEDAQELAGKTQTEKLTIERDQALQRAQEATQKAAERNARAEAKGVARDLDARPDRLDAILRQADLASAVKDGEVDEAAVKVAVEKVLADYPEWKKSSHSGPSSSGGELNGGNSGKPTFTRKQIEDMPAEERVRRIDEINEALADGRVTG